MEGDRQLSPRVQGERMMDSRVWWIAVTPSTQQRDGWWLTAVTPNTHWNKNKHPQSHQHTRASADIHAAVPPATPSPPPPLHPLTCGGHPWVGRSRGSANPPSRSSLPPPWRTPPRPSGGASHVLLLPAVFPLPSCLSHRRWQATPPLRAGTLGFWAETWTGSEFCSIASVV